MKERTVLMIRLSETWIRSDPDMIRDMAKHLYSFYTLFQFADPATRLGWGLGRDPDGAVYLAVFELDPAGEEGNPPVADQDFETDLELQLEDEITVDDLNGDGPDDDDTDPDLLD